MTKRSNRSHILLLAPGLAMVLIIGLTGMPVTSIFAAHSPATILSSGSAPIVELRNARNLKLTYAGPSALVAALQSGKAVPTALAAADFEADGATDIIAGYSISGRGALTLLRGNKDAYAPNDQSLYLRAIHGKVPKAFLSKSTVFAVPESPDFLVTGDFNGDGHKDILVGAREGGLYLLAGDGRGHFAPPQRIALPGKLTALAVNGGGDVAVGVAGDSVQELLVFDTLTRRFSSPGIFPLPEAATAVEWGTLGGRGATDVAVAAGTNVVVIYRALNPQAQSEIVTLPFRVKALALGDFIWDRDHRSEIAALADDGIIHILQHGTLRTQPAGANAAEPLNLRADISKRWPSAASLGPWTVAKELPYVASSDSAAIAPNSLQVPRLAGTPTYDLMVLDSHLNILDTGAATNARTVAVAFSGSPVAAYALPQKLNAEREIVVLTSAQTAPTLLTVVPQASVGPSWTADEDDADACTDSSITLGTTGPDGEISLREAVCEANNYFAQSNTGTVTITVPANTYNLSLNTGGVAGELQAGTVSGATISIIGLGGMPAETVINQTDGIDRDLNEDPAGAGNVQLSVSNLTMSGGFPATNGGGAILSTAGDGDTLTITNMVISGNTSTASGGGVGFLSGSGTVPLSITNTTFVNNQSATTAGGSGGGLSVSVASGISASVSLSTFTGNSATGASGAGGGIAAAGTITVSDSRIVGNVANSGTGYYQSAGTATIIDNWWGCNSGPGSSGCDAVAQNAAATAAFNPWIVLTIDANPSTIQIDGNSTLTADLTNDSNGGTGFDVPNSTPVTFSDTLGTVTPLTSTFINGTAQAIFTAGNAPGAGSGTATVDNQAVSATITITKGTPTVTVMASPTTITLGQSSTITATVSGSGLPPTGTVNVTDGLGNGLGDNCVITLSSGSGSCKLTPSAAGTLTVTATYNGDVNYGNATGTTTLTVSKAAPTVNVTPSPGTITLGQTSKMTVTVAGPNGVDAPTGTVNVTDGLGNGSGDNCIITLSSGAGNCTLTPSAASTLTVTATYSGDNNYAKADGASALTVGKATPTVMVTPMPGRITFGQSSSIAVTVTGPNGVNQPTGTVNVTDGLGSGAGDNCVITLSSGGGSCTLTPSAVGNPNVRSTYNGDSNYNPASSNAPVTVIAAPTATKVVSSLDPSVLNESITFTATVSNASSTGVPPTGKVQFVIDGNDFGNAVSLSGTGNSVVASVTTSGLPDTPSPHQVVANYENTDGNFSGSNGSLPSGQTVQDFSLTLSASSNEIWPGFTGPGGPPKGTSTLTLKAISVNGFAATLQNLACPNVRTLGGVPAPTCVFTDPKTGQPKSTLNLASGSDSAIVTISLAGQTNPPHGPNGLTPTGNYNLTVEATDTSSSPQLTHPTQFGLSVMHNQGPTCVAPSLAIPTVSLSGIQTVKATVMCSDPENALQGDVVFDWGDGTQSKVPAIASGQHEYVANHVYGNAPVAVNPLEITVTATDNVAQAGLMELPYAQPSATVSLTPGQSPAPTATINLAAVAATTVKLSCPSITSSGGAPVSPSAISLSCSFSNSSLTLSAYPNSTQVTVAIQTSAGSAAALSPSGSRRLPASLYAAWSGMPAIVFLGLGMSSIGVTRRRIRSRRFASWLGLVLVMPILAGLVACSGLSQGPGASSGTGGTPAGSYSLLVQGTDANGIVQTSAIIPVEVEQ